VVSKFTHKHALPIHPGIKSLSHSFILSNPSNVPIPILFQPQEKKGKVTIKKTQIPISLRERESGIRLTARRQEKNKKREGGLVSSSGGGSKQQTKRKVGGNF